jgi:hypothetical protein
VGVGLAVDVDRLELIDGERGNGGLAGFLVAEVLKEGREVALVPGEGAGRLAALGDAALEPAEELVNDGHDGGRGVRGRGRVGLLLELGHEAVVRLQDLAGGLPAAAALLRRGQARGVFAERVLDPVDLSVPGVAAGFEERLGVVWHGKALQRTGVPEGSLDPRGCLAANRGSNFSDNRCPRGSDLT